MTIAFLFPGQGSQAVGMGQALAGRFPVVGELLAEAEQRTGVPLGRLCFEGPAEALTETQNAQLALLVISTAIARILHAHDVRPQAAAGHSLGEYSALVESGAMPFERALALVKRRGELMAEAGRTVPGTMAAVLGFDRDRLDALCREAHHVVAVANYNAPDQIVISGEPAGVNEVGARARALGAKRVLPLQVSGAFHSPLMSEPARVFAGVLAAESYRAPGIPVYANVDARPYADAAAVPRQLAAQLDHAVRWEETMRAMAAAGVDTFIEVGYRRVLAGLAKKIVPGARVLNVEDPASLEATLAALGQQVAS